MKIIPICLTMTVAVSTHAFVFRDPFVSFRRVETLHKDFCIGRSEFEFPRSCWGSLGARHDGCFGSLSWNIAA